MALINCPECNKEISDKVISCPNCGFPVTSNKKTSLLDKLGISKKSMVILLLIIIITISTAIFMFISNSNKEKNKLFKDTMYTINTASSNTIAACDIILAVWSDPVGDFNSVFRYMFSGDIKNHSWSGLGMDSLGFSYYSWGSLSEEMNTFKERLDDLEDEKKNVDSMIEEIKKINGSEKEANAIVDYYNSYLKSYNAATDPSGNQLNYSSNLIDIKSELDSNKVKLEMILKE